MVVIPARQLPRILGAQAFIVLYLLKTAQAEGVGPVTAVWIENNYPGCGKNTILRALRTLQEHGLAAWVNVGWEVTQEATL